MANYVYKSHLFYGFVGKGWKRLTIIPNVTGATVSFVASPKAVIGNSVWVPAGTSVTYRVSANGYIGGQNTIVLNSSQDIAVQLLPGYVMLGNQSLAAVSKDNGMAWTTAAIGGSSNAYGIAYNNGHFLGVVDNGTFMSVDGENWVKTNSYSGASARVIDNRIFVPGYGYVMIYGGESTIYSKTNSNIYWSSIAYSASTYVLVGTSGLSGAIAYSSSAATNTWTTISVGTSDWNDIIYKNNKFIAVGANGSLGVSEDGVTWTTSVLGTGSEFWRRIIYGNSEYVVIGDYESSGNTYGVAAVSSDGENWTLDQIASDHLSDITYAQGQYTIASVGKVLVSDDASTWTSINAGESNSVWKTITYSM